MHGHGDNHPVGRLELFEQLGIARKKMLCALAQLCIFTIPTVCAVKDRQSLGSKFGNILVVEVQHGCIRQFLGQAIDEAVGAIRGFIPGIWVGVNNKGLHGVSW